MNNEEITLSRDYSQSSDYYEGIEATQAMLRLHLGIMDERFSEIITQDTLHFFVNLKKRIEQHSQDKERFLDLGCGIGRLCFDMSPYFTQVYGVDLSASFVKIANDFYRKDVAGVAKHFNISSSHLPSSFLNFKNNIEFFHDSVENYINKLASGGTLFSCVALINVICRLERPLKTLVAVSEQVTKGGVIIIASPYTFSAQFTNEIELKRLLADNPLDVIKDTLEDFELIENYEASFFYNDYSRRCYISLPEVSVWKKR